MHEVLTVRSCLVRTCVTVIQKWGTEVRRSDLSWRETTSDTLMTSLIFKYVQKFTWKHEDVSTWGRNRAVSRARGAWRPCHRRAGKGKEGSLRLRFCIPLRHQEAPWITGRFLEIETLNKQKQNVKSLHRQFSYFKIFIQSWYIRALFLTNIYTQVYFDQEHKVILENSVNIL